MKRSQVPWLVASALLSTSSARIADEAREDRTASRREAVADLESLGEAELFQLSDAPLERRHGGVESGERRLPNVNTLIYIFIETRRNAEGD